MNASELKYQVEQHGNARYFFTPKEMRFFGDRMSNYGVRSVTITINYNAAGEYVENGAQVEAWELYRRHPVKHGLQSSAYFDKQTFARIYPKRSSP